MHNNLGQINDNIERYPHLTQIKLFIAGELSMWKVEDLGL